MCYQITYDRGSVRRKKILLSRVKRKRLAIAAIILVIAVVLAVPSGRLWIRDLLLPGNEQITAAALEQLVQDIHQGRGFAEAITTFCQQIIYGS